MSGVRLWLAIKRSWAGSGVSAVTSGSRMKRRMIIRGRAIRATGHDAGSAKVYIALGMLKDFVEELTQTSRLANLKARIGKHSKNP